MQRALVVFHDGLGSYHWAARWLHPAFRHVFVVVLDDRGYWVSVDARDGVPCVEVVMKNPYDLVGFYRGEGFRVVETRQSGIPFRAPMMAANCVGVVKAVLAIRAPLVLTPYQLYRYLGGEGHA